ncbi:MAG: alpha/beta hydrolase family esterase [Methylotenera sp.]
MHKKRQRIATLTIFSALLIYSMAWAGDTLKERIKDFKASRQDNNTTVLTAGDYTFSLNKVHNNRQYMVHIPKSYNPNQPTPLVLSLHGGGGNMEYQATDKYYHLVSKSEEAGFIAVFPNGYSRFRSGKLATWNAGICCGKARDENSDDVSVIKAVVADIKSRANIDSNRIYANGMSNGGMMSYRLACELTDTFAAIASVAGTDGTQSCKPSRPISILHIHALDDDHVLFNGGSGVKSKTHADFVAVPDTIQKWVSKNACQPTQQRVLEVKGAYCDLYAKCQNNTQVKLCVTETGGHSWPGGSKVRGNAAGSTAINANDIIWQFYQNNPKSSNR